MKGLKPRFFFWLLGWILLYLLANIELKPFPHILILFWTLLPLLSFAFSFFFRKKIDRREEIDPLQIRYGETGTWSLYLTNRSRLLPFYLYFTLPGQAFQIRQPEVMLGPGEERTVRLPFYLPYVGRYEFSLADPVFEDLLGFFKLQFPAKTGLHSAQCFALPDKLAGSFRKGDREPSESEERAVDRKSLQVVTDEIFSIDPISEGESMAHTHWKLSARLQQWMVKHYSDYEQEAVRYILDLKPVAFDGQAFFSEDGKDLPKRLDLEKRTYFANLFYTAVLDLLEKGLAVDVGDRFSQFRHYTSAGEEMDLAVQVADIPFGGYSGDWRLTSTREKKQVLWIQEVGEDDFGSLLQYKSQGVDFLLVSLKAFQTEAMIQALEASSLEVAFLDK